ncbi:MAG: nucleoside triphosphate pyrophosphohydrolase [Acidobacteria bacterium]|nr:nucleoside triphosphate pyrophosphohydrolase [Acidobacteriota bacterium]
MKEITAECRKLVEIMDRLRGENGCPWDREQTFESLKTFLIEESYEVIEAVDKKDFDALCGELGDVQLQIVFMARIAKEKGLFTMADILRRINEKMIRRHPHVFGDETVHSTGEVLENWEKIKAKERETENGGNTVPKGFLSGIPGSLPALQVAYQIGVKTSRIGFDWNTPAEVEEKIHEEWAEMKEAEAAGDRDGLREELGDLLFTIANFARKHGIDPEDALRLSNRKFMNRFGKMEQAADVTTSSPEQLEALWQAAKAEEK